MTEDRSDGAPDEGSPDHEVGEAPVGSDESVDASVGETASDVSLTADPPSAIRSGQRLDRLAELEEERRYLLRSLKDLENERAAGDVDDVDYATLKNGYTARAASVLRQIDDGRRALAPRRPRNWKRSIAVSLVVVAFAVAIGSALASAFGERGADDQITGFTPGDDTRTTLANARAALNSLDFVRAQQLFLEADQYEGERGRENAEARAYLGWSTFLVARPPAGQGEIDPRQLDISLIALNQAIAMDPTFPDPYCFVAIIEFNFNKDADTALPFVDQCEALNPPSDIDAIVAPFAERIRAAASE